MKFASPLEAWDFMCQSYSFILYYDYGYHYWDAYTYPYWEPES